MYQPRLGLGAYSPLAAIWLPPFSSFSHRRLSFLPFSLTGRPAGRGRSLGFSSRLSFSIIISVPSFRLSVPAGRRLS